MHASSVPRLILASGSPRRRELLAWICPAFDVIASAVDEDDALREGEKPQDLALRLAVSKAAAVAELYPEALVLGADTVVALDSLILGKPRDPADAVNMLRQLRGRTHQVVTGVALTGGPLGSTATTVLPTTVRFRDYADAEIEQYVAGGDPMDKAGAYGIQTEGFHPESAVEGCLLNVIGLPVCEVGRLLREVGYPVTPQPGLRIPAPCRARYGGCLLAR